MDPGPFPMMSVHWGLLNHSHSGIPSTITVAFRESMHSGKNGSYRNTVRAINHFRSASPRHRPTNRQTETHTHTRSHTITHDHTRTHFLAHSHDIRIYSLVFWPPIALCAELFFLRLAGLSSPRGRCDSGVYFYPWKERHEEALEYQCVVQGVPATPGLSRCVFGHLGEKTVHVLHTVAQISSGHGLTYVIVQLITVAT